MPTQSGKAFACACVPDMNQIIGSTGGQAHSIWMKSDGGYWFFVANDSPVGFGFAHFAQFKIVIDTRGNESPLTADSNRNGTQDRQCRFRLAPHNRRGECAHEQYNKPERGCDNPRQFKCDSSQHNHRRDNAPCHGAQPRRIGQCLWCCWCDRLGFSGWRLEWWATHRIGSPFS